MVRRLCWLGVVLSLGVFAYALFTLLPGLAALMIVAGVVLVVCGSELMTGRE